MWVEQYLVVMDLLREVPGCGQVEDDRNPHQQEVGDDGAPPDDTLGPRDVQVAQHVDADEQAGERAGEVRHVAYVLVDVEHVAVVDGGADVAHGDQQEDEELEERELHLAPVHDDGGDVGGDKGVDATAGARQLDGGVGDGGAERAGDYACKVDYEHAPPPMHHFERQPEQDLDTKVHHQVEDTEKKK